MRVRFLVLFLAVVAVGLGACSRGDGDQADGSGDAPATGLAASPVPTAAPAPGVPRRVEITMVDMGFEPASVEVNRGETVSFVFTNQGKIPHDAFLGDQEEQDEHEREMRAMTGEDHAGHEGGITVNAGETGALRRTFSEPGTLEIGCHQPGHYAAGMKVTWR